ncbi:MAG: class II D-tagatose-bisphosphate aldolase non-catalytic subunit [Caldilineaceae bacterium]
MKPLDALVHELIDLRSQGTQVTLLAACPNSAAVLEAAVIVAARNNTPMLFAATLNQVDTDGGYTGWTPQEFVSEMKRYAQKHNCAAPLYPCLDHGGPWLKDKHATDKLTFEETMGAVKASLTACLQAGYALLHIDPTVDRTLPKESPIPIGLVVERTIDMIRHSEAERQRLGLPPIAYEVGTEEVHGGLVDMANFNGFLQGLREGLETQGLLEVWPCFIVGKVGTDLHTTYFDLDVARQLFDIVMPYGSLIKGHYTDWVANASDYPVAGMGGANVGPEFTAAEFDALVDLAAKERSLVTSRPGLQPSRILEALEQAVLNSGRWKKWLQPDEVSLPFQNLSEERRLWLVRTGARYIWTERNVLAARERLYENLGEVLPDPNAYVVERIVESIDHYVNSFNLFDSDHLLGSSEKRGGAT